MDAMDYPTKERKICHKCIKSRKKAIVSDKNSWDTSTQCCFYFWPVSSSTRCCSSQLTHQMLHTTRWLGRRKRHLFVTMFKIFNNVCPTYLREQFHRTSEIHDYNLRGSNYDLQLPLPKTNFLKRSFSYRGAMAWNQLSNETREMGDLTSFKLAIS